MAEEVRAQWGSPLEFILSVIGCAVGLGNVWRFPFLVFKHQGGPFLIPFFILLFVIGIPTFFLETAIGQFSGLSPSIAFEKMAPLFQGLGYACVLANSFIGFYYNIIIAYCLHYFIMSIRAKLLWADCPDSDATLCYKRSNFSETNNCTQDKFDFAASRNITVDAIKSPSEIYFYKELLDLTDSIENLGTVQWQLMLCLLVCWILVFVVLVKGVQILGKVSYFTATFPYLMMTILVIQGATLDGSGKGVSYYLLGPSGSFDFSAMLSIELWKDAAGQIFFALSACTGALIAMSSFSAFDNNLIRDTIMVPILDILTGFYAGFAIFTVLGNMYLTKCASSFDEVAAQGPELAFIVYPEGISLMGQIAPLFSVMFFVMMLALGFGSEFGIMETTMSTIIDAAKNYVNTPKKKIITRGIIALVYFLLGLTMVTKGGLFVLNLIDSKIGGTPLLMIGFCQVIAVPWVYGTTRFIRDIESMVGEKPKWFWIIFQISWKGITPVVLFILILLSYLPESATGIAKIPMSVNGKGYPAYAEDIIGHIIEFAPITIVIVCMIYQLYKHRNNLRAVIEPSEDYYKKQKRHMEMNESSDKLSVKSEQISVKSGHERSATPQVDAKSSSRVSLTMSMSKKVHPIYENEAFVEEETKETNL